jgi:hypothetical protein
LAQLTRPWPSRLRSGARQRCCDVCQWNVGLGSSGLGNARRGDVGPGGRLLRRHRTRVLVYRAGGIFTEGSGNRFPHQASVRECGQRERRQLVPPAGAP